MFKLLVADPHRANSEWIKTLIKQQFEVIVTGSAEELINAVNRETFDSVLINKTLPDMDGTSLSAYIKKIHGNLTVFVVSQETNMELWREVSKVKAHLLPLPLDINRLLLLLQQKPAIKNREIKNEEVAATTEKPEVQFHDVTNNKNDEQDVYVPSQESIEDNCNLDHGEIFDEDVSKVQHLPKMKKRKNKEKHHGEVILFYSWKGGVGKTTTAVNLASILQTYGDMSVGLIELTRQAGNILSHFSLNPTVTVKTWIEEKPDARNAHSRMLEDPTTGMYILPSQTLLDYSNSPINMKISDAIQIIRVLRDIFDVVVIDAGTLLDEFQFTLFEEADHIMLVSDLSFETVKENHYMPEIFRRRNLDVEKIIHIINRVDKGLGITVKDAMDIVLVPFTKTLPFRKGIMKKKEEREPFILCNDNDPYTLELKILAAEMFPENEKLQCRQSWFKKVMKKFVG